MLSNGRQSEEPVLETQESGYRVSLNSKGSYKNTSNVQRQSKNHSKDRYASTESHSYKKSQLQSSVHSPKYPIKKSSKPSSKTKEESKKSRSRKVKSRRDTFKGAQKLNQSLNNPIGRIRAEMFENAPLDLNSTAML